MPLLCVPCVGPQSQEGAGGGEMKGGPAENCGIMLRVNVLAIISGC